MSDIATATEVIDTAATNCKTFAQGSLVELAIRIKAAHLAVGQAMRHAIEAGLLLLEAKQKVSRGEWLPWLENVCGMPARTAQAYMRIARHLGQLDEPNTQRVADLSIRDALKMFSRTAATAKALRPADFEAVLTEAEETSNSAIISEIGRQKIDEIERLKAGPTFSGVICTPPDPNPAPRPPDTVEIHAVLLERLRHAVGAYREENEIDLADILTVVNEFYYELAGSDAV